MTDMLLTVNPDELSKSNHVHTLVRPVGPWRFLTPLDIIQPGDLFRGIATVDYTDSVYDTNWSVVPPRHFIVGKPFHTCKGFDIIRPIDDTAYTVPVFKFED